MLEIRTPGTLFSATASLGLLLVAMPAYAAQEEIPELSGVWQFGRCGAGSGPDLGCTVLEEDDELLTNRAKAYRDVIDEAAQPKYDCAPMPIPHMWTDPYSYKIEQLDDRVLIYYGKDDVVRTIWLDGHGPGEPAVNEFFYFGYSTGHYEEGALVVVTDKFTFDPEGLNADFKLPSSTQKRVTERFSREGENLVLEVSTIDPFFLKEAWTFRVISRPDPTEFDGKWACDLESSRQILKLMAPAYPNDPPVERIEY